MEKNRSILAGLAMALLVVLSACGWEGTGTVVGKHKTDAYTYISFICTSYNAQGLCTVQMPVTNHVPDYFYLEVQSDQDGKVHDVSVNFDYWDAAKNGDTFDNRKEK